MGSLIKNNSVGRGHADAIYLIDCEAELRARCMPEEDEGPTPEELAAQIVAQAEARAASIVEAARAEADSVRAQAHDEGYAVGHAEWDAQKQELIQQMADLQADAERQVSEYWTALEPEVLALAVDIARKIVRHEIDERQEYILSTIKTALYQLRDKREIKLYLNASDYEFLKDRKDDIRQSFDGLRSVELIEDRRVEKGGVLIESSSGHLDARIDSQFTEVEKALEETHSHG